MIAVVLLSITSVPALAGFAGDERANSARHAAPATLATLVVDRGHHVVIDGANGSANLEWADSAVLRFAGPGGLVSVLAKQDGPVLLVAAEISDGTNFGTDRLDLLVDAAQDGGTAPKVDDRWLWVQRDGSSGALKGTGAAWTADTALEWQKDSTSSGGSWFVEMSLPVSQLGVVPGATAGLGIEFRVVDENGVSTDEYFWSPSGSGTNPSTWGQATSPELWTAYPGAPAWTRVSDLDDPGQPSRRFSSCTAYDEDNDTLILFGGWNGVNPPTNDTWRLRNATGAAGPQEWSLLIADALPGSPAPRDSCAAIYDPATDRMTLFGGYQSANEVWVLVNATGRLGTPEWTTTLAGGLPGSPAARFGHSAVYDIASNRMIVFGGYELSYGVRNDVWALRRANGVGGVSSWLNLIAENNPASPRRAAHSAVYDSASSKMVVFGGFNGPTDFGDTWLLENATGLGGAPLWKNPLVQGAPGSPKDRFNHVAGLDPATGSMVIFSGADASSFYYSDAWVLAGSTSGAPRWTQAIADGDPLSPAYRDRAAAAYRAASDRLFVFGGYNPSGIVKALNDSWVLANSTAVPPGAPTGLVATAGNQSVNLNWTAPALRAAAGVTAYRIYRSTAPGVEFLLATIGPQTNYTDPGLVNGATYYYRVAAMNEAGEGPGSAEQSATPVQVPFMPGVLALVALVLSLLLLARRRRQ